MHSFPPNHLSSPLDRRLRLIRVAVLGFVLLLALGFATYASLDRHQSLDEARERLRVLVNLLAEHIESQMAFVERQLLAMQALSQFSEGKGKDPDSEALLDTILLKWCRSDPACMDLLAIDAQGRITHWTGTGEPPQVADREYVRAHLAGAPSDVFVGIPQLSRAHEGHWFFAVSLAERDAEGALKRVHVAIRDLSRSFEYASTIGRGAHSSLAVAATSGEVYVREPDRKRHMGKIIPELDRVLPTAPSEVRASTIVSRLDQVERLIATRLTRYPLFAAATEATDSIYGQWRNRLVLVISLWLLLTGIAVYVGHRLSDDARLQDYLASIDGLTGILNRRALMSEALRQQERRSESRNAVRGMGLMMLDVDHFKRINDSFGHAVGDEVLRRVAATLRMSARSSDILGRYGGEEFLLLLPGADEGRIAKVGEKLRAAVEAIPALEFSERPDYPETLTISIGGAVLRGDDEALEHAIARADRALYQAKDAGRNRVVIAPAQT